MNHWLPNLTAAALVAVLLSAWATTANSQGSAATAPPEPAPRLSDGTPNLGRVPGEKGVWDVPYITNMADRIVAVGDVPIAREVGGRGRGGAATRGTGGLESGGRGGARSEPHVPFMPWAA